MVNIYYIALYISCTRVFKIDLSLPLIWYEATLWKLIALPDRLLLRHYCMARHMTRRRLRCNSPTRLWSSVAVFSVVNGTVSQLTFAGLHTRFLRKGNIYI
jgi:hypothetical protein